METVPGAAKSQGTGQRLTFFHDKQVPSSKSQARRRYLQCTYPMEYQNPESQRIVQLNMKTNNPTEKNEQSMELTICRKGNMYDC